MYKRKKKRKEKHKKKKKKKIFALAFFLKLLPSLAFGERFSEKTDLAHSLPQNSSLLNCFIEIGLLLLKVRMKMTKP